MTMFEYWSPPTKTHEAVLVSAASHPDGMALTSEKIARVLVKQGLAESYKKGRVCISEKGIVWVQEKVLQTAAKALIAADFAIIGPVDVNAEDKRKVLLVSSRLPRGECPSTIVRVFATLQSFAEFISYVYLTPDGSIDIETINASFNRRDDLKPNVEKALGRLRDQHVKKLLAVLKKTKLASRVHSNVTAINSLPCSSPYYLNAFDGWPGGILRCEKHRGHDDDHRATYRKEERGMFGQGGGLAWVNPGPAWIVKSLTRRRA